ncbi:hypothetical protein NDU88_000765 [Pleurodeles waltl]|uniref:Uncharacterized protein n=1 Tax=Pleurodeles waltl TaxID=8319 RepID=A0AAV7P5W9_PLEWA|nr:hypothetical protein NDU88_000765 [Pleurodeles waltl]
MSRLRIGSPEWLKSMTTTTQKRVPPSSTCKELRCSRLSDNAAPDSPELQTQLFVRDVDEVLPSFQGNENAGTHLGNPDIRVSKNTKKEDGLGARHAGEEVEQNADRDQRETGDERRIGTNEVPPKTTGHPREKKEVEPRALRHVPGRTWLTKVRSFIKDNIFSKGESNGSWGEGRDSTGRGEGSIWKGQKEEEQD